jgi:Zn-dependent protease/CBS domain-containing protein
VSLGKVAGIPVHVSPTWFIVVIVITVGFVRVVEARLGDLGPRVFLVTFTFAVLLYGSVLLHELSHALTARAFGLPVRGITLHFLGGYTEIERESPTPGKDIVVSVAGPLASLGVAGLAWLASIPVDRAVPEFLLWYLAITNLLVGIFNLLPALPLDGGHMLRAAVWKVSGNEHRGTIVAARAGQVLAVLVLLLPFVIARGNPEILVLVWAALIAMLLWTGAAQALASGRVRSRLPRLDLRRLTRRAAPVIGDVSVAEAMRQAAEAGVEALVVVDAAGRPTGLVNEAAVKATPEERRPWVSAGQLARSISEGLILKVDATGEDILATMRTTPASEYLVVDGDGAVYGVLSVADVEAALTTR